jgi:hypothetical protein
MMRSHVSRRISNFSGPALIIALREANGSITGPVSFNLDVDKTPTVWIVPVTSSIGMLGLDGDSEGPWLDIG